jgi:predicted nucleic acid-binding protein
VPEMILVDTSVWVSHLRHGDPRLVDLLDEGSVLVHPFVIGELACGNLKNRAEILSLLRALPLTAIAEHEEIMLFIETNGLMGRGLGYVDVHLLAAAVLSDVRLWTGDRSLLEACADLGLGCDIS